MSGPGVGDVRPGGRRSIWTLLAAIVAVGVAAGLAGALVAIALKAVEHLAYGYSSGPFLVGAEHAPAVVRVAALGIAGLLGGVGWWALRRFGRPVVAVEDAVEGSPMPASSTLGTVALQIGVVGLGASIGRELAPRLLGALAAERIARVGRLAPGTRRVLIAAGAGAGLAAVYNVPLGGTLFALEILLAEFTPEALLATLGTSAIATVVARIAVPATSLYAVPRVEVTPGWLLFALIAGPVLGLAGTGFDAMTRHARRWRPRPRLQLIAMPVAFLLVGGLAVAQPSVLGNGKALAQLSIDSAGPLELLLLLAVLKALATAATIFSGADGGTLTPSVSIGAALGAAAALPVVHLLPGVSVAAGAVMGAAAFLAAAMEAPLTAAVLLIEFTGSDAQVVLPVLLAVAGATVVRRLVRRRFAARTRSTDAAGVDGG
ncbi:MAG: chloride channel protein [Acidobacteria bacterium]|nr:chloride channel protein [Acidobacteriota bacterium]